jgi:iron(III) transport system permease protein
MIPQRPDPATALRLLQSGTSILTNTMLMGAATSLCAVTIGGALALMLVRTDLPGRATLEPLALLPLYVTPLLTAIAWSWLGSPRGGLVNLVTQRLAGTSVIDLHGTSGVVFLASLAYAPVPFLLIAAGLRATDPSLEDNARVHGASLHFAFSLVRLALVLPSALGALVLVFVQTMGLFSIPAVLGVPGGFTVIATEIYHLLNTYLPRPGQASAWGLVLASVRLDHGAEDEEYEEMIAFHSKVNFRCRLIMWRNAEAVFVQPLIGRRRRYNSVCDALEFMLPTKQVVLTDIKATFWPTLQECS